jgi:hypothetical protein
LSREGREAGEVAEKIPKGFNHSARRWPMQSGYAGWWNKMTTTLKGLNPFARI